MDPIADFLCILKNFAANASKLEADVYGKMLKGDPGFIIKLHE